MNIEARAHDNIDRDIIEINRDSLLLRLHQSKEFFSSTHAAFGYAGIAISFLSSAFLTDTFKSFLQIPGETIRMIFAVLGIVSAVACGRHVIKWWQHHETQEPEAIVDSMLKKTFQIKKKQAHGIPSMFLSENTPTNSHFQKKK